MWNNIEQNIEKLAKEISTFIWNKLIELKKLWVLEVWNNSNNLSSITFGLSLMVLYFSAALFVTAHFENKIRNNYEQANWYYGSFISKNDDIRVQRSVSALPSIDGFIVDKNLYIETIDQFYRMQGIALSTAVTDKLYGSKDIVNIYDKVISKSFHKDWNYAASLRSSLLEISNSYTEFQLRIFFIQLLSQIFLSFAALRVTILNKSDSN